MELESAESDFLVGDVVVSTCNGIIPILFEITESPHASFDEYVRCRSMSGVISYWLAINEIRTATTAEVQANRRLEAEHALAEVS
ncbi:hypothetical protein ACFODO_19470 [Acinetobacter sichuanensis]|uniref:DUF1488 family protein n=1 Tax=Acinetobacter sichuanensis TaxID=2136183 RepID=A0ABV7BKJ1_9GAMM